MKTGSERPSAQGPDGESREGEPRFEGELSALAHREQRFYEDKKTSYDRVRGWISRAIGEFDRTSEMHAFYDPAGKVVLDYGCGGGRLSLKLLSRGARDVVGIDVSDARLEEARRRVADGGFAGRARFLVVDAHNTGFPDGSFDLVVGSAVLHHLELPVALAELRRIMKPGARAVFAEPLAHNPILRVGRALTPSARTPDEHPITTADWTLAGSIFRGFRHEEKEFLSVFLMPFNLFLPRRWQGALASWVARADDRLLARFPSLRKHARMTILILE